MSFIQGYDPETLRELVDQRECAARLAEIENQRSLPALLERVWLLKVLDRLDEALSLADEAVRQARMAGTRKDVLRARVLHATVLQYRGSHAAAEQELATCSAEAEGQRWAGIAAFASQHRGKNALEAGDYEQARESFKQALFLRREAGADEKDLETVLLAIDTVERLRVLQPVFV
ncbi:hypothetical protein [Microbacterium istanbulense]|uniref:Tetratricopeptide repeat protein n=1 Tax=Microbacterium istanbulense TaxID=3122049 RepID=A0ABU8LJ29_9MICO